MSIRLRILAGFFVVFIGGIYLLVDFLANEVRPHYLETVEESMIDTANILASYIEIEMRDDRIVADPLRNAFALAHKRKITAKIHALFKRRINLDVYVTDRRGIVLYDSRGSENEGKDYSRWNDVIRSLRGEYGARSTRSNPDDRFSSSLYVSAPIRQNGSVAGVVTVIKPEDSVTLFINLARRKIIIAGFITCAAFILTGLLLSFWITTPITRLTEYIRSLRENRRAQIPVFSGREITTLARAFEELWDELKGKKYIEQYIQTLTHELKSPLSSIRGAAELLMEEIPDEARQQFHKNIYRESRRIEDIIGKLLCLSSIESRDALVNIQIINFRDLSEEVVSSLAPQALAKNIAIRNDIDSLSVCEGEMFLLRHSVLNLVANAIQFAGENGHIVLSSSVQNDSLVIRVSDDGEGIPGYALEKVFDKFYSLSSKSASHKGSGLGLPFVREAMQLHGGSVALWNNPDKGVTVEMKIPLKQG